MRLFATLALAATLLAPAALAQSRTALLPGPTIEQAPGAAPFLQSSAAVAITPNSSTDVESSTIACGIGEGRSGGTTENDFYRVIDLTNYSAQIPDSPVLSSVDFGLALRLEAATSAPATLSVYTLPAGTDVSGGFSRSALTEVVSQDLTFSADVLDLVTANFDEPAALTGSELLVVEVSFPFGGETTENPGVQFDASAGSNEAAADGVTYLGTTESCGAIDPTPIGDLVAGANPQWVVILNVNEDGAASSFADARAAGPGATVTVEGVVSRAQGDFLYLQDETGGLVVRQTSGDLFDAIADGSVEAGTVLRLTGTLSEFNSLLQINGDDLASFEATGTADVPAPQDVTLSEIATNGEDYEGELVRVSGVTIDGSADADGLFDDRESYDIDDGSGADGAVVLRVPNADDSDVDGTQIPTAAVTVVGVVGQFSSTDPAAGYQILVIRDGDIGGNVAVGEDPEGRIALGALAPNPAAGSATVRVSLAAPGHATLALYDVLGRQVAVVVDEALAAGERAVSVDVAGLPAGAYLARLTANGAAVVRPFTVVR